MAGVFVWRCALGRATTTWVAAATVAATAAAVRPCGKEMLGAYARSPCCRPLTTSAAVRAHAGPERRRDDDRDRPPAWALDGPERQRRAQTNQVRRPWHRAGAEQPPAEKGGGPTKGKILTTPSRLFQIVLPLPLGDGEDPESKADGGTPRMEPLSFLVHPQQPISYVQRLIQAELPPLVDGQGRERPPDVTFWAEDAGDDDGDGAPVAASSADDTRADPAWVRWGSSTEMGDFVREAARGREFAIRVGGSGAAGAGTAEMRVTVPSFADRTRYQRRRLRRLAAQIEQQAAVKRACDALAHRGARRLALGGFGGLAAWWAAVYWGTYCTPFGWDGMEPVTYLAGLAAVMGGYLWFLFISRDLSYQAAMRATVSRRRAALYARRGFDARRWERLADEANALRGEIRRVAAEYGVDWDETANVGGERVQRVLEKEERLNKAEEAAEADNEDEDEADEADEKTKK